MKQRLRNTFTSYISLQIYTTHINMSQRGKVFEVKIRNRKAHDRTQNASQFSVLSVCSSSTSDHYWGDLLMHQPSSLGFNTRTSWQATQMGTVAFSSQGFKRVTRQPTKQDSLITSKGQMKQKTKLVSSFNLQNSMILSVWFLKPRRAVTLVNFNYLFSFPRKWIQVFHWLLR